MSEKFGNNLKNARLNKGFSQRLLADKLKIGEASTISKWEKGTQEPELAVQEKISEILGVSLDTLVKGSVCLLPEVIEKLKSIPQIKLNRSIYGKNLPKCELDPYKNSELFYEFYENDEENTFMQYLVDFGGAYNLEEAIGNNGNPELYAKIESLYKSAWAGGDGLYEAGVNLLRFWFLRDIEEQQKGNDTFLTQEGVNLLLALQNHDLFYCGFEEIVFFYKALFQVYGLYCGSADSYDDNMQYKMSVNEFIYDGYRDMVVLADKEKNPYAESFVDGVDNIMIKKARESLKDVSAYDYWNKGHELTDDEKAYIEDINSIEKIFDEIEESMYKMES